MVTTTRVPVPLVGFEVNGQARSALMVIVDHEPEAIGSGDGVTVVAQESGARTL